MKRRPLGFHQGLDLFDLMRHRRVLFYTLPLWLPVYLMGYIYWHVVLVTLPEQLRLRKLLRRLRG